jgi:hypothetical protein
MNKDPNTNCDWCNDILLDYISGNLNEENNKKIQSHLSHCINCRTVFEKNENERLIEAKTNKFDFQKLRNRFIRKVILIVVITMISLFLITGVFMPMLFNMIFGHRNEVAARAFADAIMFTIPSAKIESFYSSQEIMSLKLSCKYSHNPYLPSNEIKLTIPNILGKINSSQDIYSSIVCFDEQANLGSLEKNKLQWVKMNKIGDISVCQAVVYFSSPISIAESDDFLSAINANRLYTWVAIDTGNIELNPKISSNWSWGFPMSMQKITDAGSGVTDGSLLTASKQFQREMQFLEKEGKYLGKNILEEIKAVNNYITDNGIKVKGVVVIARTNDLLKYRDNQLISQIDVVKAELDYQIDF